MNIFFPYSNPIKNSDDNKYRIWLTKNKEHYQLYAYINDKNFGSEIEITFIDDLKNIDYNHGSQFIEQLSTLIRGIKIKEKSSRTLFFRLYYTGIRWNFLSPNTDKFLSISRDYILDNKKGEINDSLLSEFLPEIIKLFINNLNFLSSNISTEDKEKDSFRYLIFFCHLILSIDETPYHISDEDSKSILKKLMLPDEFVKNKNSKRNPINALDFFQLKTLGILIPIVNSGSWNDKKIKNEFITNDKALKAYDCEYVSIAERFLEGYIKSKYRVYSIKKYGESMLITFKPIENGMNDYIIEKTIDDNYIKEKIIKELIINSIEDTGDRKTIYPILPYAKTIGLSHNHRPAFIWGKSYSNGFILSPFKNMNEYQKLIKETNVIDKKNKSLRSKIVNAYLKINLNKSLITFIKSNSIKIGVSENEIIESYAELITDLINIYYPLTPTKKSA